MYIALFTYGAGATTIQMLSLFLIYTAGLICIINTRKISYPSPFESFLFILILISFVTSMIVGRPYVIQYTMLFSVYFISLYFIARTISANDIVDIYSYAFVAILFSVFLFEYRNLITSLSVTVTDTGLYRFTPLGMHPNLTGIVYAGTFTIMMYKTISEKVLLRKVLWGIASISCIVFVLAASARASILGLVVAGIFGIINYLRFLDQKRIKTILLSTIPVFILCIIYIDVIWVYLEGLLELNSESRGVDSGGTGRSSLWARGIQLLFDSDLRLFLGYGFRSATVPIIGFSVESSYINIALETGLFGMFGLIGLIILLAFKSINIGNSNGERGLGLYTFIGLNIIFLLFQSIFNRYLISIGSFYNIFFMLILFSIASTKRINHQIKGNNSIQNNSKPKPQDSGF